MNVIERLAMGLILMGLLFSAVMAATNAKAETLSTTCHRGSCTTHVFAADANPRIIDASHPIDEARDAKWVSFCKPAIVIGQYGVSYYHYAHAGCEYGRIE